MPFLCCDFQPDDGSNKHFHRTIECTNRTDQPFVDKGGARVRLWSRIWFAILDGPRTLCRSIVEREPEHKRLRLRDTYGPQAIPPMWLPMVWRWRTLDLAREARHSVFLDLCFEMCCAFRPVARLRSPQRGFVPPTASSFGTRRRFPGDTPRSRRLPGPRCATG